jgi:predicted dehydrogenase
MGTQIHAGDNYRRVVEWVQSGLLGPIHRVHVWNSSRPVAGKRTGTPPTAKFDRDVWLGPAPVEFFEASIAKSGWNFTWPHFHWRWWWEFGGGTLADLGCHYIDLPFWALGLTAPTKIYSTGQVTYQGDNTTPDVQIATYDFPAVGTRGPVQLIWSHGTNGPTLDGKKMTYPGYGAGVLFEGTKGQLLADYGKHQILPEEFGRSLTRPDPSIPKSVGHHAEWIQAIKNGGTTTCHFDYSGALTETVLLGNVSYRCGRAIEFDAEKCEIKDDPSANRYLGREARKGWTV